jgi:hypothetical protein
MPRQTREKSTWDRRAAKFDVNPSTVQRVAHPFEGADNASVADAA